ncbi:MAG: hypothetical protein EOO43_09770 [Flavobacterium sp.]|nr:MAG: hypothetical protein EOO43_09770 [Flavobacterium sp.]
MKEKAQPCPELAALFEKYGDAEEIAKGLDDIQYVLVDYARLNELSVEKLPNRYYLLNTLRNFFQNLSRKYNSHGN